jgi:F-type H+-transporting ATPase subunit delta
MRTTRQAQREAKKLFRLCLVNGALDEGRVRQVVRHMVDAGRPGGLSTLSHFQRLVRLDGAAHRAHVESATPLAADVQADIEAGLVHKYGRGIVTSFTSNPHLIGGVRIRVGSDVYDGSVRAGLATLEARFAEATPRVSKG